MPINAVWLHVDGEHVGEGLQEALENLAGADGEVGLDLSDVRRIDASAVGMLQNLASAAESKSVKVVLRSVNVDVYKVLKLLKLSPRFSFAA